MSDPDFSPGGHAARSPAVFPFGVGADLEKLCDGCLFVSGVLTKSLMKIVA